MKTNQLMAVLAAKAVSLNGLRNAVRDEKGIRPSNPIGDIVSKWLKEYSPDPEATAELYRQAFLSHNRDALASLNRLRVEAVSNMLLPTMQIVPMFFQITDLADDEMAVVQTETSHEVAINYLSTDGAVRSMRVLPDTSETIVPLFELMSEEVQYRIRDIQLGQNIGENVNRTLDIAFDLAMKVDRLAYAQLTASIGAFTLTGARKNRTYVVRPEVDTTNLPTTNSITAAGTDASSKFRTDVFDATLGYCDSYGGQSFKDGPLRPTGKILVPSGDIGGLLSQVSISGSQNNSVAESLLQNYTTVSYAGITWQLIPDATLPPKSCYPQLNKPLGTVLFKAGMDAKLIYDDAGTIEAQKKNLASRSQGKVVGMYVPAPKKVNVIKVIYRS